MTNTTTTYRINANDSEQPPAWLALCVTATPVAQDSGRCAYAVTTTQPEALEAALEADVDVIRYEAVEEESEADATQAVDAAIVRSINHNEIVTIDWTAAREAELESHDCREDSVVNGRVYEAWGTEDGSEWRVHLTGRPESLRG